MTKKEIIARYKKTFSKYDDGIAELILFVFVNDQLVLSKQYHGKEEARNMGWDLVKSTEWHGFDKIEKLSWELINFMTGKTVDKMEVHVLGVDLSKRKKKSEVRT